MRNINLKFLALILVAAGSSIAGANVYAENSRMNSSGYSNSMMDSTMDDSNSMEDSDTMENSISLTDISTPSDANRSRTGLNSASDYNKSNTDLSTPTDYRSNTGVNTTTDYYRSNTGLSAPSDYRSNTGVNATDYNRSNTGVNTTTDYNRSNTGLSTPSNYRANTGVGVTADYNRSMTDSNSVMVGGAAMLPNKNIIENAINSRDHTTLVAAIKAAGLVDTLSGNGPFTVFAPTNAAFSKLPAGTVETLLKPENKSKLAKILTYHVVSGKMNARDLLNKLNASGGKVELKTVQGDNLTLKLENGAIKVMDNQGNVAQVIVPDVNQSNGVIHVVDIVLLPQS